MRQLIIDDDGPRVQDVDGHWGTLPGKPHQSMNVVLGYLVHPERLEVKCVRFAETSDYSAGRPQQPGMNDWTKDEVVRAQAAGNDALMRDNRALSKEVAALKRCITGLEEANTRQLRQNEGLRNDVRQAESAYESAARRVAELKDELGSIKWILEGKEAVIADSTQSPLADLARRVIQELNDLRKWDRRWPDRPMEVKWVCDACKCYGVLESRSGRIMLDDVLAAHNHTNQNCRVSAVRYEGKDCRLFNPGSKA